MVISFTFSTVNYNIAVVMSLTFRTANYNNNSMVLTLNFSSQSSCDIIHFYVFSRGHTVTIAECLDITSCSLIQKTFWRRDRNTLQKFCENWCLLSVANYIITMVICLTFSVANYNITMEMWLILQISFLLVVFCFPVVCFSFFQCLQGH